MTTRKILAVLAAAVLLLSVNVTVAAACESGCKTKASHCQDAACKASGCKDCKCPESCKTAAKAACKSEVKSCKSEVKSCKSAKKGCATKAGACASRAGAKSCGVDGKCGDACKVDCCKGEAGKDRSCAKPGAECTCSEACKTACTEKCGTACCCVKDAKKA